MQTTKPAQKTVSYQIFSDEIASRNVAVQMVLAQSGSLFSGKSPSVIRVSAFQVSIPAHVAIIDYGLEVDSVGSTWQDAIAEVRESRRRAIAEEIDLDFEPEA